MATQKVVSVQDGPRVTVASMVKNPTVIPARIISDLQQQFIVDALLRRLPTLLGRAGMSFIRLRALVVIAV